MSSSSSSSSSSSAGAAVAVPKYGGRGATVSLTERKGNWSCTRADATDVVEAGQVVDGVQDVYVLPLPVGRAMQAGATTFANAFDRNNHVQAYYEALLQLVLKVVADLRVVFAAEMQGPDPPPGLLACQGEPVKVFLECVTAAEPDPALAALGALLAGADQHDLQTRPFLRGVPDTHHVVEYRVWVFVRARSTAFDFDRIFADTIASLNRQYVTSFGHAFSAKKGGGGGGRKKGASGGGDGADESFGGGGEAGEVADLSSYMGDGHGALQYGKTLGDTDKWRLMRSDATWCLVVDMMLGWRCLTRKKELDRVLGRSLLPDDCPAHARYMLAPSMQLSPPNALACPRQQREDGYLAGPAAARTWTFPVPDRVLCVQAGDQLISRFMQKLLPDYQLRSLGDDLDSLLGSRPATGRAQSRFFASVARPVPAGEGSDDDDEEEDLGGGGGREDLSLFLGDDEDGSGTILDAFGNPSGRGGGEARGAAGRGGGQGRRSLDDEDQEDDDAVGQGGPARAGGADPDSVRRMVRALRPARGMAREFDTRALEREDYEDLRSQASLSMLNGTDSPDRSAFHRMHFRGARFHDQLVALQASGTVSPATFLGYRRAMQVIMLRDFESTCMSSTSDVSRPWQQMNSWWEERKRRGDTWLGHDEPKIDGTLSTLANVVARRLLRFESGMFMANMHGPAVTICFGTLDAYRHEFDLHWNCGILGDRATSKSFTLDLLQFVRIDKTVNIMQTSTKKADFVWIWHEFNTEMFRTGKHGGNDKEEEQFKDWLTSMHRRIKAFVKDARGRRMNRHVVSQNIASIVGNSNAEGSSFSSAVRSRFSLMNFQERRRRDRHAADLVGIEKQLRPAGTLRQLAFKAEMSAEQYLHLLTEKLISIHVLADVTLSCYSRFRQILDRRLRHHSLIDLTLRTQRRIALMLVITNALELLFSSPRSKYWKQPFSVFQLVDLDPLLHDNEEMCHMAMDMHRHELVSGSRGVFIKMLHAHCVEEHRRRVLADDTIVAPDAALQSCYLTPDTVIATTAGGGGGGGRSHGSSSSGAAGYEFRAAARAAASRLASGGGGQDVLASEKWPAHYMFAYMRAEGLVTQVSRNVADWSRHNDTVITEEQARQAFYELCKETIHGQRYRWNALTHQPEPLPAPPLRRPAEDGDGDAEGDAAGGEDREPVEGGPLEGPGTTELMPAALQTPGAVFIHMDLVGEHDAVEAAIRYCFSNRLAAGERRRYLSAVPVSNDRPHFFRVRELTAADGRDHFITDFANEITPAMRMAYPNMDFDAETRASLLSMVERRPGEELPEGPLHGPQRMRMHYDEISRRERAVTLGLDPDVDGGPEGCCSFEPYERYAASPVPPDHPLSGHRRQMYCQPLHGLYPDQSVAPPKRKGRDK